MNRILTLAVSLSLWLATGCDIREGCTDPRALNYDPDAKLDGPCEYPSETVLTQSALDAVIVPIASAQNLRGNVFGVPGMSAHADPLVAPLPPPDSTERSIYSSHPATLPVPQGAIISKRVWRVNPDGMRGARIATFLMVKQNPGFFPAGGDYEYIVLNAAGVSHMVNPNGVLTNVMKRGKLAACASCHAFGGSDFLFER